MTLSSLSPQRFGNDPVDPFELRPQSSFDSRRAALANGDAANMRSFEAEIAGNSGKKPVRKLLPQNFVSDNRRIHVICGGLPVAVNNHSCTTTVVESREKMHRSTHQTELSLGQRVKSLRERLGVSQKRLGEKLGITQAAVEKIENSKSEPSAYTLMALGNLASDPDCWFFWKKAGMDIEAVDRALSKKPSLIDMRSRDTKGISGNEVIMMPSAQNVAIALLNDATAAASPRVIDERQVDHYLAVPKEWCPHPEHTTCIKVSDDAMSPMLEEGYIVAVDAFNKETRSLIDQMIAVIKSDGNVSIRWLRKSGKMEMLVAEKSGSLHQPVVISAEPDWKIVGRIVWWVGMAALKK
jgi:transcriptional regulator with XRE-family HTH domain